MTIWLDAQLSPKLATWIQSNFEVKASSLRSLGFRHAGDYEIFQAAAKAGAIVMSKDSDFLHLLDQHGPPPKILWITCGNTSNEAMQAILTRELGRALELLSQGERMVEIRR